LQSGARRPGKITELSAVWPSLNVSVALILNVAFPPNLHRE
jgi:hypothetical protein